MRFSSINYDVLAEGLGLNKVGETKRLLNFFYLHCPGLANLATKSFWGLP